MSDSHSRRNFPQAYSQLLTSRQLRAADVTRTSHFLAEWRSLIAPQHSRPWIRDPRRITNVIAFFHRFLQWATIVGQQARLLNYGDLQ